MIAAADSRRADAIGRRARLELVFERRGGRTVLAHSYAEPPLRAGRCFEDAAGLHMIIASSAPGVFGGDAFEQRVRIGRGCRVRLTSQSALQVHPGGNAPAGITSHYLVEDDAELRCEWEPLIPFAGARVAQRIFIELAASARLFWSDALMCGRQARGERWAFESLAHELRVERCGRLEYLERYRVMPGLNEPARRWVAGGASYIGTVLSSGVEVGRESVEALHAALARRDGVNAVADRLDSRLLLVRLMAADGAAFHAVRRLMESPHVLIPMKTAVNTND